MELGGSLWFGVVEIVLLKPAIVQPREIRASSFAYCTVLPTDLSAWWINGLALHPSQSTVVTRAADT